MMSLLFGGTMFFLMLSSFASSVSFGAWNRAYIGLYGGAVEACVVNFDPDHPSAKPHFQLDLCKRYIGAYVEKRMEPHCLSMDWEIALGMDAGTQEYQRMQLDFLVTFAFGKITRSAVYLIKVA